MRYVSRLRVIAEGADEAMALALHDTANFVLTLVRVLAPVDTGWLRDSYKKESISLLHILIGTMVNYAVFQEFGTSKMAAQPHLGPAFAQGEAFLAKAMKDRLEDLG